MRICGLVVVLWLGMGSLIFGQQAGSDLDPAPPAADTQSGQPAVTPPAQPQLTPAAPPGDTTPINTQALPSRTECFEWDLEFTQRLLVVCLFGGLCGALALLPWLPYLRSPAFTWWATSPVSRLVVLGVPCSLIVIIGGVLIPQLAGRHPWAATAFSFLYSPIPAVYTRCVDVPVSGVDGTLRNLAFHPDRVAIAQHSAMWEASVFALCVWCGMYWLVYVLIHRRTRRVLWATQGSQR